MCRNDADHTPVQALDPGLQPVRQQGYRQQAELAPPTLWAGRQQYQRDTPFYCDYGIHTLIGDNVIIGMNCTFVDCNTITIGNNVLIASNVQIYTASHSPKVEERIVKDWHPGMEEPYFRTYALPVVIEDNVWIGGGVIILPGVTIGRNAVIGAGSVVTKSIPPNTVAVGNPCRVLRSNDGDQN